MHVLLLLGVHPMWCELEISGKLLVKVFMIGTPEVTYVLLLLYK